MKSCIGKLLLLICYFSANVAYSAVLVGWSSMGLNTYTAGPFSQHQPASGWAPPSSQIVGGFSAAEKAADGSYIFLIDTGFGPKPSSFSSLLGLYDLKIDFNDFQGNDKDTEVLKLIRFNDIDNKLSFAKQADFEFYGNNPKNNPVDSIIKKGKLLTGGDIDPESVRVDYKGNIWVGDEFGPFLIKLDNTGKVLRQEISIPNITSPENPLLKAGDIPTIKTTAGLEGMAINRQGNRLYPMLEKPVIGDPEKTLRIYEFNVDTERFEEGYYLYKIDGDATEIRELVAINDNEFLTIEQNESWDSNTQVKKVYWLSIKDVEKYGYVKKRELVDLMNISDPVDLNKDGNMDFSFPKLTIESIIILDKDTLLITNDNNFGERTEFIKVRLDESLNLQPFNSPKLNTADWKPRDKNYYAWQGFHNQTLEWINIAATLFVFLLVLATTIKKVLAKADGRYYWAVLSAVILALLLYNYLSLYFYATQAFRDLFIDSGLYQNRGPLQRSIMMAIVVATALLFFATLFYVKNKYTKYSMVVICMMLGLKGTQFVSYHRIDAITDYQFGIGRVFDWVEAFFIILLFLAFLHDRKVKT
ncbi:MAG: esterase-like activity of phytase family protein [Pseudomonadota bacterium]